MPVKYKIEKPKIILLDIEGTVTPIDFVHKTLFGYIRQQIDEVWIERNESILATLGPELIKEYETITQTHDDQLDLKRCLIELMDKDSKAKSLKEVQACIMKDGYKEGSLKSVMFDDVKNCIEQWRSARIKIYIYSSGNIEAQKLLFSHTTVGDLTGEIDGYFDTNIGSKLEPSSYTNILNQLKIEKANNVLFVTDSPGEVKAAAAAGLISFHINRPGNSEPPSEMKSICSLIDIGFD